MSEIVERLEAKIATAHSEGWCTVRIKTPDAEKLLAHIRELEAAVPQWVSVEDRLPEIPEGKHGVSVVVGKFHGSDELDWDKGMALYTRDGKFLEVYLNGDGKGWTQEQSAIPPTHWFYDYLPQPPAQGVEG